MENERVSKFFLIRHGQSVASESARRQRPSDALSDKGRKQARDLAESLPKVDTVSASTYKRAIETASYISSNVRVLEGIGERGEDPRLEGAQRDSEINQRYLSEVKMQKDDPDYKFLDGESSREMFERAEKFLDNLTSWDPGTHVIVGHHLFLKSVIARAQGGDLQTAWDISLSHASISEVEYDREDGRWIVNSINQTPWK